MRGCHVVNECVDHAYCMCGQRYERKDMKMKIKSLTGLTSLWLCHQCASIWLVALKAINDWLLLLIQSSCEDVNLVFDPNCLLNCVYECQWDFMHYIKTTRQVGSMHASKRSTTDSRGTARRLLVMHYALEEPELDSLGWHESTRAGHLVWCSSNSIQS